MRRPVATPAIPFRALIRRPTIGVGLGAMQCSIACLLSTPLHTPPRYAYLLALSIGMCYYFRMRARRRWIDTGPTTGWGERERDAMRACLVRCEAQAGGVLEFIKRLDNPAVNSRTYYKWRADGHMPWWRAWQIVEAAKSIGLKVRQETLTECPRPLTAQNVLYRQYALEDEGLQPHLPKPSRRSSAVKS